MKRIGVLALQGAFAEHVKALQLLGADGFPVRLPEETKDVQGLIIPGGESTTIGKLMATYGFPEVIRDLAQKGIPIFGTCAGLILLAQRIIGGNRVTPIGLMDIVVRRNAFGRQVDSFEAHLSVPILGEKPFPAVFIRAPVIQEVGEGVDVLARLPDGTPVAARKGNILATAFHPELTQDLRFHRLFLSIGSAQQPQE